VPPSLGEYRIDIPELELSMGRARTALVIAGLLWMAPTLAAVIDEIAVERGGATPRVRLQLTGPVHYLRAFASRNGEIVNVRLQALAPLAPGMPVFPDEVRRFRGNGPIPPFSARVSLDPRCEPVPNPVCITIQFDRPVRSRVRLGEDRRSLLLDFPPKADDKKRSPSPDKTN
jgi:hypothetical protein